MVQIKMKQIIRIFVLLLFCSASLFCRAQQLVQTTNDVYKLVENKQEFIGKPLSNLLAQIKPPIKRVAAMAGGEAPSCFLFWFLSDSEFHARGKVTEKPSIRIYVQVTESNFDWDPLKRPKGHRLDWTKEDEEKYGNLTVVDIRVTGSN